MNLENLLAGFPQQTCAVRGRKISYRESGAGSAVVLLHGISSGSASWVRQLDGLQREHRVIAWDAPGYESSDALEPALPLASDYAAVLHDFVECLGLSSFGLVGHSLGALMAAAYAHAHPGRVGPLVLLSPARGYALADAAEREAKYTGRLEMLDRLGPEGLAQERASRLLSRNAGPEDIAWIARGMRRLNPGGYRQAAAMLAYDDLGRYTRGYEAAVAVGSGEVDGITPVAKCQAVARLYSHGSYASIPGVGHALYLEDPVRTGAFLRAALAAQAGR